MSIFRAKIVMSIRSLDGDCRGPHEVWEKVLLFESTNFEVAYDRALARGKGDSVFMDDISWLPDNAPMKIEYEGFRELEELVASNIIDAGKHLIFSGALISYSVFEVPDPVSAKAFSKSLTNDSVKYLGLESRTPIIDSLIEVSLFEELSKATSELDLANLDDQSFTWRGANLVFSFKQNANARSNDSIVLLELLFVLTASTDDEGFMKADRIGSICQQVSIANAVQLEYLGTRQLIQVDPGNSVHIPPSDNAEISFTKFRVLDNDALHNLVRDQDLDIYLLA